MGHSKEAILVKQSKGSTALFGTLGKHTWRDRWCVLNDDELSFSEVNKTKDGPGKIKGVVLLYSVNKVYAQDDLQHKHKNVFNVDYYEDNKALTFTAQASSTEEREAWMQAITANAEVARVGHVGRGGTIWDPNAKSMTLDKKFKKKGGVADDRCPACHTKWAFCVCGEKAEHLAHEARHAKKPSEASEKVSARGKAVATAKVKQAAVGSKSASAPPPPPEAAPGSNPVKPSGPAPAGNEPPEVTQLLEHASVQKTALDKYALLARTQAEDPGLYYASLVARTSEVMPLVYTPTVGAACQHFSQLWPRIPHSCGLFLRIGAQNDSGRIAERLSVYSGIKAIVVTDGQRILGLGDLGANGMGIPVGKMALYTGLGGLRPEECLPVTLDCGTNTESILTDPDYIGLRKKRTKAGTPEHQEYMDFVDEFVVAVRARFGKNTLIQWEDFGNENAFVVLEKYKNSICCFNDDIQGTASVALAGFLAASPTLTGTELHQQVVLFAGAGEAGCGIANLISTAMAAESEHITIEEARQRVWLFDSRGLVVKDRSTGGLAHHKLPFAHQFDGEQPLTFLDAVKAVRPTAIIGVSAQPGTFTKEVLQEMASYCDHPIVFPLSNPTSKAECTAEFAYTHTGGKAVVASGSPFPAHTLPDGTVREPGQGNNVYIFPGLGLGAKLMAEITSGDVVIDDTDMLRAAKVCASMVTKESLRRGTVYPELSRLREVAARIAFDFIGRRCGSFMSPVLSLEQIRHRMYAPKPHEEHVHHEELGPIDHVPMPARRSLVVANAAQAHEAAQHSVDACTTVVVFGASGDLAKKKTFPSLWVLYRDGLIDRRTRFVGYARSKMTQQQLADKLRPFLLKHVNGMGDQVALVDTFLSQVTYCAGTYDTPSSFTTLSSFIDEVERPVWNAAQSNRIFYLALPPSVFKPVTQQIRGCCWSTTGWNRMIVEKPFGRDSASSQDLSDHLTSLFKEPELYRIDHYLGKEMVQKLLLFRFSNRMFSTLWNRKCISSVQITFKEPFGTKGRGGYFDNFGIIRDILQNHLLQVLAIIAMDTPASSNADDVRDEKVKVLRAIKPIELADCVLGQYTAALRPSRADPDSSKSYRDDDGVPDDSVTPTFATTVLNINNPRWDGVPFILKAGKALDERKAEVRIQFKEPPTAHLFPGGCSRNELVFRIQPKEAVWININTKAPNGALSDPPQPTFMDLSYHDRFPGFAEYDAYDRLILDCFNGSQKHFVRSDELVEAWRIFTPLLHAIEEQKPEPIFYEYGSRGPHESDLLISKLGFKAELKYDYQASHTARASVVTAK